MNVFFSFAVSFKYNDSNINSYKFNDVNETPAAIDYHILNSATRYNWNLKSMRLIIV